MGIRCQPAAVAAPTQAASGWAASRPRRPRRCRRRRPGRATPQADIGASDGVAQASKPSPVKTPHRRPRPSAPPAAARLGSPRSGPPPRPARFDQDRPPAPPDQAGGAVLVSRSASPGRRLCGRAARTSPGAPRARRTGQRPRRLDPLAVEVEHRAGRRRRRRRAIAVGRQGAPGRGGRRRRARLRRRTVVGRVGSSAALSLQPGRDRESCSAAGGTLRFARGCEVTGSDLADLDYVGARGDEGGEQAEASSLSAGLDSPEQAVPAGEAGRRGGPTPASSRTRARRRRRPRIRPAHGCGGGWKSGMRASAPSPPANIRALP